MKRAQSIVRPLCLAAVLLAAKAALAQETQLGADFRKEGEAIRKDCSSFSSLASCGEDLFTDHPLHIAVGSLAPQNGFGAGLAFVAHWTPNETWRLNWNVDAVATSNQSWRAGAYMTAVWDRHPGIVVNPGGTPGKKSNLKVTEYPTFHVFAQGESLNKLTYFGEGPNTREAFRSYYGMTQTVVGVNAVFPVIPKINMSLYAEANGRFVDIRGAHGLSSPSIDDIYGNLTAPGLFSQPAFAQFGEGVRIRPSFAGDHIRLNYYATFQEFIAGDSNFSFNRLTIDAGHEFPFYKNSRSFAALDHNGPDDCSISATVHTCPAVTRNLEGSFNLRFIMNASFVPDAFAPFPPLGHQVPFYFQPTLGGSDINGFTALGSYQDYRFRAANNILARASFEHSIWGPLGLTAMIDEGKVATNRGDLNFTHLLHTYSAGLTLRAGGFPMVYLMFSFGGHEGMHTSAIMNTSLLGGSARPSLY
jgi:hypothetical protein